MANRILTARPANAYRLVPSIMQRRPQSAYRLPPRTACLNCRARRNGLFCAVSPPALQALLEIRRTSKFPAGAILFMEGEEARGVYIVCEGRVKLLTTNSEGKTLIFKIAKPGEVLGLNEAISGSAHEITAEILEAAQLAYISREDFMKFIKEHGDACLQVAQHLGRDCHLAYDVLRSIGLSNSVEEKLARFLLEWCADGSVANGALRTKLALTHEEIAQLIGCSRESVSRSFSDFKRKRLVVVNGSTLVVPDKAALAAMVEL